MVGDLLWKVRSLTRRAAGFVFLATTLAACHDSSLAPTTQPQKKAPVADVCTSEMEKASGLTDTIVRIHLPTYMGSSQVVHPDILHFHSGWRGCSDIMAVTPYTGQMGEDGLGITYEDPEVFVSRDGVNFYPPPGLVEPVMKASNYDPQSNFSDADIELLGDSSFVLHARLASGRGDIIYSTTTTDLVSWSKPIVEMRGTGNEFISASYLVMSGPLGVVNTAWFVDASQGGCYSQHNTVIRKRTTGNWSANTTTDTVKINMPAGYTVWHLDVFPGLRNLIAFIAGHEGNDCADSDVFLGISTDGGKSFSVEPTPLLARGMSSELALSVYRSSGYVDEATNTMGGYYSGRNVDGEWEVAARKYDYNTTIARLHSGFQPIPLTRAQVSQRRTPNLFRAP